MTAPARFRQADLTRAAKGAAAAGLRIASAKIGPDGSIVLLFDSGNKPMGAANSWDDLKSSAG